MKVSGTSRLSADPAAVWQALTDPTVLVQAIPGCQQLQALGVDEYKMTINAGVGSVKGVYDGHVRLTDQEHPESFRMSAQGAGAPGTIGCDVVVTLAEHTDGGTVLTYDADATVGGMIGGVGQRMLTGVSKKMAEEFFGNVESLLAGGAPAAAGPPQPSTVGPAPAEGVPSGGAQPGGGVTPGQVFTAPGAGARPGGGPGFLLGVLVGASAALAGAVVGGWIAGRRR